MTTNSISRREHQQYLRTWPPTVSPDMTTNSISGHKHQQYLRTWPPTLSPDINTNSISGHKHQQYLRTWSPTVSPRRPWLLKPSLKASSCPARQEIISVCVTWRFVTVLAVACHPPYPEPVDSSISHSYHIFVICVLASLSHPRLCPLSDLPTRNFYIFLVSPMRAMELSMTRSFVRLPTRGTRLKM